MLILNPDPSRAFPLSDGPEEKPNSVGPVKSRVTAAGWLAMARGVIGWRWRDSAAT
jgi:hypothetical protein